jgi:hypothetical protein
MYDYQWTEEALDKLADLYIEVDVPDRERMAAGVQAFNARLAADPLAVGESQGGGYRIGFSPLLRVFFKVDMSARKVWVVDVKRFGR